MPECPDGSFGVRSRGSKPPSGSFLLKDADYRKAETILAYIDTQQEISTRAILEDAWRCGKTTAVPRVEGKTMEFYQITSYEDLEPGHFGVWEPKVHWPGL